MKTLQKKRIGANCPKKTSRISQRRRTKHINNNQNTNGKCNRGKGKNYPPTVQKSPAFLNVGDRFIYQYGYKSSPWTGGRIPIWLMQRKELYLSCAKNPPAFHNAEGRIANSKKRAFKKGSYGHRKVRDYPLAAQTGQEKFPRTFRFASQTTLQSLSM